MHEEPKTHRRSFLGRTARCSLHPSHVNDVDVTSTTPDWQCIGMNFLCRVGYSQTAGSESVPPSQHSLTRTHADVKGCLAVARA